MFQTPTYTVDEMGPSLMYVQSIVMPEIIKECESVAPADASNVRSAFSDWKRVNEKAIIDAEIYFREKTVREGGNPAEESRRFVNGTVAEFKESSPETKGELCGQILLILRGENEI